MDSRVVGRIVALWRYPVKSMAGEPLEAADVSWHGLAGDRRWAFIRAGLERSNFPWLTIRDMRMRVDKRDPRCVLVNVDPDTTERDPSILRWIAQERDTCLGVYGSTVAPGAVAVGAPVLLE